MSNISSSPSSVVLFFNFCAFFFFFFGHLFVFRMTLGSRGIKLTALFNGGHLHCLIVAVVLVYGCLEEWLCDASLQPPRPPHTHPDTPLLLTLSGCQFNEITNSCETQFRSVSVSITVGGRFYSSGIVLQSVHLLQITLDLISHLYK